ncbi:zinc finger BED domain-containing protein 5-like [Pleurodeles waltl]|uniref:zinc finger BED domain-containing protein 5-like n=1 Tax=Pleurodeles waltl TaxID=8319 RepID=UPI00370970C2
MKPSKLRRHLETKHREHATKCTEFFKNKEQELGQSRKIIKKTAIGSFKENALKASYEVSMLIAKAGKPHTIAEELIVPAAKAMVSAMVGEKAAKDLDLVPLSNNTVKRRIDKIYKFERNIIEDLLFCRYLIHATAEEVFSTFNEFLTSNGIQWSKCIGISTDGARAMSGRLTGLVARIREINSSVVWHHCCIHRESLATKKMPEELKKVLNESVKIVNLIKARSLNSRLFEQLCQSMDSDHRQLLLHIEVRWLLRGRVLSRVFELRDEIRVFFTELESPFALDERLHDYTWLAMLAYVADIFTHLNVLNLSMQGVGITIFNVEDKIEAMIKKLDLWARRLSQRNFDSFRNLTTFLESADDELAKEVLDFFIQHLQDMRCSFRQYFPLPDESKNWIKDPFSLDIDNLMGLTSAEENGLIEISTDSALKLQFKENYLVEDFSTVKIDFYAMGHIPNITGAIDGTHIAFIPPSK